jgi:UDP-hydrolysing UDP-N-acetyl-D-glucosamine 2-epimerase
MSTPERRAAKLRKICVFTGTRAEYGLLRPLIAALKNSSEMDVQLLVSGTHLSAAFGSTWLDIVKDGLAIDEKVEMLLDSATPEGVCTSIGLGVMRYGDALRRLAPACVVVLGDRFEALAMAVAASVVGVPVVHLHGGELTLGAQDDAFRHAITKLSWLHFTSTEVYRRRVIQLGESPDRVFNVGALGVENIRTLPLLSQADVERKLDLLAGQPYLLVTFHPATLDRQAPEVQLSFLLQALARFPDHALVFTGANADTGGEGINRVLADHARRAPSRFRFFMSLGAQLYLSAARWAGAVVGNSSSAIIEVPSLGVPSVDIGCRQAGRIRAASVLHSAVETNAIVEALGTAMAPAFRKLSGRFANPYEKPGTTQAIVDTLLKWNEPRSEYKSFYDWPAATSESGFDSL